MSDDPTKALLRSKNPFAFLLGRHRKGFTFHELGEELRDLNEAVASTGKTGTLTVTVKVKPASKGSTGQVVTAITSKSSVPQNDREDVLFIGLDGALSDRDPAQPSLPLMEDTK